MRKCLQSLSPRPFLWGSVLVVVVVAASAASFQNAEPEGTPQERPPDRVVAVTLANIPGECGAYDLWVHQDPIRTNPGGVIHWRLDNDAEADQWMISFPDGSPAVDGLTLHRETNSRNIVIRIDDDAAVRTYKYSIVVFADDTIYCRDPEIEVGDPDN
jgi:hypothetical protein